MDDIKPSFNSSNSSMDWRRPHERPSLAIHLGHVPGIRLVSAEIVSALLPAREYDAPRFLKWIVTSGSYDRRVSIFIALLAVLAEFLPRLQVGWVASAVVAGLLLSTAWRERKPLPNAKKPLVMTARAKRIYAIAFVYAAGMGLAFSFLYLSPLWWIIPIQLMPLMLAFAVWTLAPQERFVQKKYWQEAHEKLGRLAPKVIGITGSFGKTSTKHILSHVLENASSGLATPGSVNTPMGIARIVREQLVRSTDFSSRKWAHTDPDRSTGSANWRHLIWRLSRPLARPITNVSRRSKLSRRRSSSWRKRLSPVAARSL